MRLDGAQTGYFGHLRRHLSGVLDIALTIHRMEGSGGMFAAGIGNGSQGHFVEWAIEFGAKYDRSVFVHDAACRLDRTVEVLPGLLIGSALKRRDYEIRFSHDRARPCLPRPPRSFCIYDVDVAREDVKYLTTSPGNNLKRKTSTQ